MPGHLHETAARSNAEHAAICRRVVVMPTRQTLTFEPIIMVPAAQLYPVQDFRVEGKFKVQGQSAAQLRGREHLRSSAFMLCPRSVSDTNADPVADRSRTVLPLSLILSSTLTSSTLT